MAPPLVLRYLLEGWFETESVIRSVTCLAHEHLDVVLFLFGRTQQKGGLNGLNGVTTHVPWYRSALHALEGA
jgi:hypothetical protein